MQTSDFLFPRDLQITPTSFKRILFIGSCLSEAYAITLRGRRPQTTIDYILFNHASNLPAKTRDSMREYDFQYIQLPLRSLLTDGIVRLSDPDRAGVDWLGNAKIKLDLMWENAISYHRQFGTLTLVSNFIVPQGITGSSLDGSGYSDDIGYIVRELNRYLAHKISNLPNVFLADVEAIASAIGKRHFLDDIIFFYAHGATMYTDWPSHERYPEWTAPEPGRIDPVPDFEEIYPNKTPDFFETVFRQMEAIYRTVHQIDTVKLVIFDLDNTLWRGQLAEHYQQGQKWPYCDGWPMGLWEAIHHLKRRGIIVSIASKNDHDYVRDHWERAVSPGFLKFDDFIVPKINWIPKAENIRETIRQLSLTASSVVFVDDNPVERESVATQIPGIRVMGSNPFLTRRILLWSPETQRARLTAESTRREDMLKAQLERENKKITLSRDEFLRGLNTELEIWEVRAIDHPTFNRVFELVNKTNQFNTTGRRWSLPDYSTFFDEGGSVFAFKVKDKFTDYGTVGVIFFRKEIIYQYVMSCRVLGMEIETTALAFIVDKIRRSASSSPIIALFTETESNTPCRIFYPDFGFVQSSDGSYVLHERRKVGSDHVTLHFLE